MLLHEFKPMTLYNPFFKKKIQMHSKKLYAIIVYWDNKATLQ